MHLAQAIFNLKAMYKNWNTSDLSSALNTVVNTTKRLLTHDRHCNRCLAVLGIFLPPKLSDSFELGVELNTLKQ